MHNAFMQRKKKQNKNKTSYIALENYVYTVLFRTSSYQVLMYHWCFPLFFFVSLPPKILIKSNQTFQIIERIYTAPYLLFIIINYYSFYKRKISRSKIYKTALSFSVIYPVIIYARMKSHLCIVTLPFPLLLLLPQWVRQRREGKKSSRICQKKKGKKKRITDAITHCNDLCE